MSAELIGTLSVGAAILMAILGVVSFLMTRIDRVEDYLGRRIDRVEVSLGQRINGLWDTKNATVLELRNDIHELNRRVDRLDTSATHSSRKPH